MERCRRQITLLNHYLSEIRVERIFFFFFFWLFKATLVAHGGSQARGLIRATAADLRHSHSNTGSKPHLQTIPQLVATPDP